MTAPLSTKAAVVNRDGTATRALIGFLQGIGSGVLPRTIYTYAEIAPMTPTLGHTVICGDSSVVTVGDTLAGGGASIVQAIGNGSAWKVI